jgi:hypothetical protein
MNMPTLDLTVLVCGRDGAWSAQCIEFDIAAQAKTLDDVLYEFERTLHTQLLLDQEHGREPLGDIPPAPEEFRILALSAPRIDARLPRFQSPKEKSKRALQVRPQADLRLCPK